MAGSPEDSAAPAEARPRFDHVPGLDGIRGLAVVAVLLYHAGHLTGGYLGVDLFFVLSGYLITSLLLVEHHRDGAIALRAFWGRRMRRLLPALFALLAGAAAYARWVARPVDYLDIRGDAYATLGYVANWHTILKGADYWDISKAPSPLQHTWSLAIEEQFYVIWPFVVWAIVALVARRGAAATRQVRLERAIGRVAVVGAAAAFALFVGLGRLGVSTTRLYEGTDTRAGAILVGVALAVWAKRRRAADAAALAAGDASAGRASVPLEVVGVAAAVALGVLWVRLDGESPWLYRGLLPVASVLAVLVVAAVADPRSPVLGRLCSLAPLRWLGTISYGLYLWHWPIYQALELRNGRYPGLGARTLTSGELLVAKLVLSLVVAVASYLLIEQPVRTGRLPRPAQLPAAGAAAVAVLAVVTVATRTSVTGPATGDVADTAAVDVRGAPTLLLIGDSVAESVARPIIADPTAFGVNPTNRTRAGCSEVATDVTVISFAGVELDPHPPPCGDQITDAELRALDPDLVYVQMGARPNDFLVLDGESVRACTPAYDDVYRRRIGDLLDRLGAGGARVGLVNLPHSGETSLPVEGSEERIDCVNRLVDELVAERPFARVLDLDGFLCPEGPGSCREEIDGATIRSDGLHLDPGPGGVAVSRWLVDRLAAP